MKDPQIWGFTEIPNRLLSIKALFPFARKARAPRASSHTDPGTTSARVQLQQPDSRSVHKAAGHPDYPCQH